MAEPDYRISRELRDALEAEEVRHSVAVTGMLESATIIDLPPPPPPPDGDPPNLAVAGLTEGQVVQAGAIVTVLATASDISGVEYVSMVTDAGVSVLMGAPPYQFEIPGTLAPGAHSATFHAADTLGNTTPGLVINFTVAAPPPPPPPDWVPHVVNDGTDAPTIAWDAFTPPAGYVVASYKVRDPARTPDPYFTVAGGAGARSYAPIVVPGGSSSIGLTPVLSPAHVGEDWIVPELIVHFAGTPPPPPPPPAGSTFYASPTGSDAAAGTQAAPWKSAAKVRGLAPGETLLLQGGGTFPGGLDLTGLHGTAGNPITLGAYGTGKPRITGQIKVGGSSYLTLRGVAFNSGDAAVYSMQTTQAGSDHVVLDGCLIDGASGAGVVLESAADAFWQFIGGTTVTGTKDSCLILHGHDHVVEDCDLSYWGVNPAPYGMHGIYQTSKSTVVRRTTLHHSVDPGGQALSMRFGGCTYEDNIIHDVHRPFAYYNDDPAAPHTTSIIRRNRIYSPAMSAYHAVVKLDPNGNRGPGMPEDWEIYENTVIDSTSAQFIECSTTGRSYKVHDNAIAGPSLGSAPGGVFDHNVVVASLAALVVSAPPALVPQAGSPLLGAGTGGIEVGAVQVPDAPAGDRLPMGVVANSNWQDALNASKATFLAESVRIEMDTWDPAAWVSTRNAVKAAGIPHALLHWSDTWGATNARAAAIAAALAAAGYTKADTDLGAGNEDSYAYKGTQGRGADYGRAYAAARAGIAGRFNLVAQADDPTGAGWVAAMYAAVSGLVVDVWDIHPYGPKSRSQPMIEGAISRTAAKGSDAPIHITEYGFSTNADGGAMNGGNYDWPAQNWQQAADALNLMVPWFKTYPRLTRFYYFQALDQSPPDHEREHNFGLCLQGGAPKTPLVNAFRTLAGLRTLSRFHRLRRALGMRARR